MTSWSGGYVVDVPYTLGYYRTQTPSIIALACLLGGVLRPLPRPDEMVSYLELGCGQGFGAVVLAASNPCWRITAVDFNPAHIAAGRAFAAEIGLNNIHFVEADLATLDGEATAQAIPEADFASLHGVWSWVTPAVQVGIVRLLRLKLRAGGAVHVSYNALPGWAGGIGLQRLIHEGGRRLAWRSDRQVEEGLKLAYALNAADAVHLRQQLFAQSLLQRLRELSPQYLAHEYINSAWTPCFHADVVGALAAAKVEWVASAQLIENFPDLTLSEAQRVIYQRFEDPLIRELVKDFCMERTLRHDVFVRGPHRIGSAARDAVLKDVFLSLNGPASEVPLEADVPAGRAEFNAGLYRPIVNALERGPCKVGDLLELPGLEGNRSNPAELVGILVGLRLAEPVLRPGTPNGAAARRLNQLSARLLLHERTGMMSALASESRGAGIPASDIDIFVADRILAGEDESSLDSWVSTLIPDSEIDIVQRLRKELQVSFSTQMPILRAAGIF